MYNMVDDNVKIIQLVLPLIENNDEHDMIDFLTLHKIFNLKILMKLCKSSLTMNSLIVNEVTFIKLILNILKMLLVSMTLKVILI